MNPGTTVRHKLSGDILIIKEFGEIVCRCKRTTPITFKWLGMEMQVWGAVCLTENLEVIEPASKQLELKY